jgi:alpha-glucosidase
MLTPPKCTFSIRPPNRASEERRSLLSRIRLGLALIVLVRCIAAGQWHSVGTVEATSRSGNNEIQLQSEGTLTTITILANDLIHVRFQRGTDDTRGRSWAVVKSDWEGRATQITDSGSTILIQTSQLNLLVNKRPMRLVFEDLSGKIINQDDPDLGMCYEGDEVRVWKTMPQDEQYYGFGEKAGKFLKRNVAMTMWNSDIPGYSPDTDPLYQSVPFFLAIRKGKAYGIFLDNTWRSSFDMGKESRNKYAFGAEAGDLDYYFFYGPSPKKILSRFTELVGRSPLPPRWALGYQQSRWSYTPESRVREIAHGFRNRKIPCDVIYLDIGYMDGYRVFTWDPKAFPNPSFLLNELSADGFKIVVIIDPGIKVDSSYHAYRSGLQEDCFVKRSDGSLYTGKVWPGVCVFPDFSNSHVRAWWGEQFAGLVASGVVGWWTDMNEPSVFDVPTKTIDLDAIHKGDGAVCTHAEFHNAYGLEMTRATYEGILKLRPDKRPFVLTRASFAGGERYAAAWTGDNVATWEHLGMALTMCLGMSISGQPFVGSDIGGFIGHPSGELFARWLQLGVFTPLMRGHSVINEKNKEPWEYGAEFTDINRQTINLRYRLLPYIYTTMATASTEGLPAMRPIMLEFPEDESLSDIDDEFMFGSDILVAPVLEEGENTRSVQLPSGTWYDYWSSAKFPGKSRITVEAPVGRLPFFIRAGAVIPTEPLSQYIGETPVDPLTLIALPPPAGTHYTSNYYEDDGISLQYEQGSYFKRLYTLSASASSLTLNMSAVEGTYTPSPRRVQTQFRGIPEQPATVRIGQKRVERSEKTDLSLRSPQWSYERATRTVLVTFQDTKLAVQIDVQF